MSDDPNPGKLRWLISCDESGVHGSRLYGFGTLWMKWQRRGDFVADIRAIRQNHNYPYEFKWNKAGGKGKKDFYKELIQYFFQRQWLAFHCLFVEKASVDLDFHDRDWDLARRKHLYMLITNKIKKSLKRFPNRDQEYRIWIDPIASRYKKADEELLAVSNNELKKLLGEVNAIESVQTKDSKESPSIQLCDLLLGATISGWQRESVSPIKEEIRQEIAAHLGWDKLSYDTRPGERKFNLWYFYDPTRGPRIVESKNVRLKHPIGP